MPAEAATSPPIAMERWLDLSEKCPQINDDKAVASVPATMNVMSEFAFGVT